MAQGFSVELEDVGSALPAAAPAGELPAIQTDQSGKIVKGQSEGPFLPGAPTPEARERQVQREVEIPLFRDPKELAAEQGELTAIQQRPLQEQTIELAEGAEIVREKREREQASVEITKTQGRAQEVLDQLQKDNLITGPQKSLALASMGDGATFNAGLDAAGIDIGAGQTFANKIASINTSIKATGGLPLTELEIRRIAGAASVSADNSRISTQRIGNVILGTVYDRTTGKFTTSIIRTIELPRPALSEEDVVEAETALIEVMGERQWGLMHPSQRRLNVENYLESLRLGQAPRFGNEVQSRDSVTSRFFGLFGGGYITIRPTEVLPPLDLNPDTETENFRNNNPR